MMAITPQAAQRDTRFRHVNVRFLHIRRAAVLMMAILAFSASRHRPSRRCAGFRSHHGLCDRPHFKMPPQPSITVGLTAGGRFPARQVIP